MPIRLTKEQFAQRLSQRPQGQSQQDFVAALLRGGEITQQDLDQWHLDQVLNTDPNKVIRAADWQRMTRGKTAAQVDALAMKAAQNGMQIEGYAPPAERQREFNQAMTRKDEPSILRHPSQWWNWHTPAEKHDIVENMGEFGGGTIGGIVGTAASGGNPAIAIPSAGVGAVAGKGLGHELGPKAEHRLGLEDLTNTLLTNMALEGAGSAIPMAFRAFKPTPAAQRITALFEKLGIPVDLPTRTGNQWLAAMRNGAGDLPVSRGIVQRANNRAYQAWEKYMGEVLDNIHPQSVTRDDLARITQQAMERARSTFNTTIRGELDNVATQIHPRPVTARRAGEALQEGLADNKATLNRWADQEYPAWVQRADNLDAEVDASNIYPAWKEYWNGIQPEARNFMPDSLRDLSSKVYGLIPTYSRRTLRALNDLAGGISADGLGGKFVDLSPEGKAWVLERATEAGVDLNKYMNLDAQSAMQLRRAVSRQLAQLDPNTQGTERHFLGKVLTQIDDAIGRMPNNLGADFQRINDTFKEAAQATRPPARTHLEGNPVAGDIAATKMPEDVSLRLTKPFGESEVKMADTATNPNTMERILGVPSSGSRPLNPTARLAVENLGKKSEADLGRVSPGAIESHLATPGVEDTYRPLLGDQNLGALEDVARPSNVSREQQLYESDLARAVDNPSQRADATFNAMFPKRSTAGVVDTNLGILPDRAVGERAFAQDLVDSSRARAGASRFARATENGTDQLVNPGALDAGVKDYGDTVGHVLAPTDQTALDEGVEAAKHLQAPLLYANTSNTAPTHWAIRTITHPATLVGSAIAGGYAASPQHLAGMGVGGALGAGTALLAASALTRPGVARLLTRAGSSKLLPWMERAGGALGRAAGIDFDPRVPMARPAQAAPGGDDAPPPIPGIDDPPPIPGLDKRQ